MKTTISDTWIALRDRNARYFHAMSLVNKNRMKVTTIHKAGGVTIMEAAQIREVTPSFFLNLFSKNLITYVLHTSAGFIKLDDQAVTSLATILSESEI